jgi:hypothetical protein
MGPLEIKREASGPRHWLDGQPVHSGALLELRTTDQGWVLGRYEWSYQERDRPTFHIDEFTIRRIAPTDLLRWPTRRQA